MRFEAPQTVDAAVSLLAEARGLARVLAGGTDLIVQIRSGRIEPDLVVDLKRIPQLREIVEEDGGYRIGAAVCGAELSEHDGVKALWPGVVEATDLIGSTQIQGRATMAGNLCNASPAADAVPALVAAGATVRVAGPKGERDIPVQEVPTGPGKTSLGTGEFVTSIYLPGRPANAADAYLRFIPRTEMDIAVVGAGVFVELDGSGTCRSARVALGAVGPKVLVVEEAANALIGTAVSESDLEAVADAASAAASPIDDKRGTREFRTKVAGVIAKRAAATAFERARSSK